MTGWGRTRIAAAKAAGFDHHMVEPVAPEEVAEVLSRDDRGRPAREA